MAVILVLISLSLSFAELCKPSREWYSDSERGWFWGEWCPPAQDKEKKGNIKTANPDGENESETEEYISMLDPKKLMDDNFLESLNYKDFRKLFEAAVGQASIKEDEDLAKAVVHMMDFARRKSVKFAYAANLYAISNERYNIIGKTGSGSWSWPEAQSIKNKEVDKYLREKSDKIGLYYFYSAYCSYCHKQSPIIKRFSETYGVNVLTISTDTCKGDELNCVVRPDLFDKFGVRSTPHVVLVYKNADRVEFVTVAIGLTDLQTMRDTVFQYLNYFETGQYKDWVDIGVQR